MARRARLRWEWWRQARYVNAVVVRAVLRGSPPCCLLLIHTDVMLRELRLFEDCEGRHSHRHRDAVADTCFVSSLFLCALAVLPRVLRLATCFLMPGQRVARDCPGCWGLCPVTRRRPCPGSGKYAPGYVLVPLVVRWSLASSLRICRRWGRRCRRRCRRCRRRCCRRVVAVRRSSDSRSGSTVCLQCLAPGGRWLRRFSR